MPLAAVTNSKAPPAKTNSLTISGNAGESRSLARDSSKGLENGATAQEGHPAFRPNFVVPAVIIATTTAGLAAAQNRNSLNSWNQPNQATTSPANTSDSFARAGCPTPYRPIHPAVPALSLDKTAINKTAAPSLQQRLMHVATAVLAIGSVLLLRRAPRAESKLHGSLISTDWKEWAKVGLGITGLSQVNAALNWTPPLWLQSMTNVLIVGPLTSGFTKKNMMQAAMLAPVVSGMAQATQYLSEKSEDPFQNTLHLPPVATHMLFSAAMMMTALRVFPWVNRVMPVAAGEASSASARSGMISTCTNGCCSSLVCVNDMGQLGASLVHSIRQDSKVEDKPPQQHVIQQSIPHASDPT